MAAVPIRVPIPVQIPVTFSHRVPSAPFRRNQGAVALVSKDPPDPPDRQAAMVVPALLGDPATLALQVETVICFRRLHQNRRVRNVLQDLLAQRVHLDPKVFLDLKETLESLDAMERPVDPVRKGPLVPRDSPGNPVKKVLRENLARFLTELPLVHLAHQDLQAHKDHRALQEKMVNQAHKDPLDPMVMPEKRELMELLDPRDHPDRADLPDSLAVATIVHHHARVLDTIAEPNTTLFHSCYISIIILFHHITVSPRTRF